jgi:hypothetical protein
VSKVLASSHKPPTDGGSVAAYVNYSRWVADCVCRSGMALSPGQETAFCLDCGRHFLVEWPADTKAIEAALLLRPKADNRNWTPAETVADLEAENRQYLADERAQLLARMAEIDKALAVVPVAKEG